MWAKIVSPTEAGMASQYPSHSAFCAWRIQSPVGVIASCCSGSIAGFSLKHSSFIKGEATRWWGFTRRIQVAKGWEVAKCVTQVGFPSKQAVTRICMQVACWGEAELGEAAVASRANPKGRSPEMSELRGAGGALLRGGCPQAPSAEGSSQGGP